MQLRPINTWTNLVRDDASVTVCLVLSPHITQQTPDAQLGAIRGQILFWVEKSGSLQSTDSSPCVSPCSCSCPWAEDEAAVPTSALSIPMALSWSTEMQRG